MSIVLASTTESQEALNHGTSPEWRTPPSKPEEPAPSNGEIPLDQLPPKRFNEAREQQIRENKDAARDALNGEENGQLHRKKGGGAEKRIDSITKRWRSEESLRIAAERELAELKASLNGAAPAPEQAPASHTAPKESAPTTPEAQPKATEQSPRKIEYEKKFTETAARYPDFKETLEAADRSGIKISDRLDSAIRATGNVGDVAYFLAKNPKLISELEKDPTRVAQISKDLRTVTIDRESELVKAHGERLRKSFPDSSKLQKLHNDAIASGIGTSAAINSATIEQTNSDQVALYLLQNHKERAQLLRLSPAAQMAEVGRIAERLEAKANRPKVAPPPPIEPVTNASSRGNLDIFSKDVPMSVYIRERNKAERARGRR